MQALRLIIYTACITLAAAQDGCDRSQGLLGTSQLPRHQKDMVYKWRQFQVGKAWDRLWNLPGRSGAVASGIAAPPVLRFGHPLGPLVQQLRA